MTTSHPVRYSRFFDREARSLAGQGYDVRIVGLGSESKTWSESDVKLVSVKRQNKAQLMSDVAGAADRESCDVYQCLDPWTLPAGLRCRRRDARVRLVYEASEWFPRMRLDRRDQALPTRWLSWLAVTRWESAACRHADAIIDTNRTRAVRFQRRGCDPVLVPNYPPLELLPLPQADRQPWLAWTGLVSRARGFEQLLPALVKVVRRYPEVRVRVIGEFDPRDDIEVRSRSFMRAQGIERNLEFLGSLSYQAMFAALRPCLAGLILLQPERGNDYTGQPNKLFEFMGSGLAVVASDFPEIGPIVRECNSGWLVDPRSPEAIAEALLAVLQSPGLSRDRGEAGRQAVRARYHWGVAEKALLDLYARLAS